MVDKNINIDSDDGDDDDDNNNNNKTDNIPKVDRKQRRSTYHSPSIHPL